MTNYFNLIPQELNDEVCLYLDYNDSLILRELFGIKINYQRLLSLKFPGFYKIIKDLKDKDVKYKDFPYEKGYSVINSVNINVNYLRKRDKLNLKYDKLTSENIEDVMNTIHENMIMLVEVIQLLNSYGTIKENYPEDLAGSKYYKYKNYFPDIASVGDNFTWICDEFAGGTYYRHNLDHICDETNYFLKYGLLLLYVLETPQISPENKNTILSCDPDFITFSPDISMDYESTYKIMYEYILKYLK
jgi:hypothetical protein